MGGLPFDFWDWKYPVFGACVDGCLNNGIWDVLKWVLGLGFVRHSIAYNGCRLMFEHIHFQDSLALIESLCKQSLSVWAIVHRPILGYMILHPMREQIERFRQS
jgi:hypothetical protein